MRYQEKRAMRLEMAEKISNLPDEYVRTLLDRATGAKDMYDMMCGQQPAPAAQEAGR